MTTSFFFSVLEDKWRQNQNHHYFLRNTHRVWLREVLESFRMILSDTKAKSHFLLFNINCMFCNCTECISVLWVMERKKNPYNQSLTKGKVFVTMTLLLYQKSCEMLLYFGFDTVIIFFWFQARQKANSSKAKNKIFCLCIHGKSCQLCKKNYKLSGILGLCYKGQILKLLNNHRLYDLCASVNWIEE